MKNTLVNILFSCYALFFVACSAPEQSNEGRPISDTEEIPNFGEAQADSIFDNNVDIRKTTRKATLNEGFLDYENEMTIEFDNKTYVLNHKIKTKSIISFGVGKDDMRYTLDISAYSHETNEELHILLSSQNHLISDITENAYEYDNMTEDDLYWNVAFMPSKDKMIMFDEGILLVKTMDPYENSFLLQGTFKGWASRYDMQKQKVEMSGSFSCDFDLFVSNENLNLAL